MLSRRAILIALAVSPLAVRSAGAERAGGEAAASLVAAARMQIGVTLYYEPAYEQIAYPMGDVPRERGVCTDVVIRAYRDALGLDLQALIHRDMRAHFARYPQDWGATGTDRNIDHRRVGNQRTYLARQGARLSHDDPLDFVPGDVLSMTVAGGLPHVAIMSDTGGAAGLRIIHNIGRGAREEGLPAGAALTGRYRWFG